MLKREVLFLIYTPSLVIEHFNSWGFGAAVNYSCKIKFSLKSWTPQRILFLFWGLISCSHLLSWLWAHSRSPEPWRGSSNAKYLMVSRGKSPVDVSPLGPSAVSARWGSSRSWAYRRTKLSPLTIEDIRSSCLMFVRSFPSCWPKGAWWLCGLGRWQRVEVMPLLQGEMVLREAPKAYLCVLSA